MKFPTGVQLLDHLFGGGLPERSAALLYGPSFLGKEQLARQMFLSALKEGIPGVYVVTNSCAADVRRELARMDPAYADHEKDNRVWIVDCYSRTVGGDDPMPHVTYLDSAVDLNAISVAVNQAQARIIERHEHHLIMVDSVSTLVVHSNAATAFRFLQVLTGKAKRAGGSSLMLLDSRMHTDAEVQMFRHLANGVISVRGDPNKHQLLVEGLGVAENPGWIDYRFTDTSFEMTGSLAGGRIR